MASSPAGLDLPYFAYGSNMDPEQMTRRCPSSTFVCRALLVDHALAFTRWSPRRACGVADVVPSQGSSVWGVVYALDDDDARRLDGFEGFVPGRADNAYRRVVRPVRRDAAADDVLAVMTYEVCERATTTVAPSRAYRDHLVAGASHWGLPAAYVTTLRALAVAP